MVQLKEYLIILHSQKSDWNLSVMDLYKGHCNTKCASISTPSQEQKWHNLWSLEIGIVDYRPVSMTSLWFEMQLVAMMLHSSGVNGYFKNNTHSYLKTPLRWMWSSFSTERWKTGLCTKLYSFRFNYEHDQENLCDQFRRKRIIAFTSSNFCISTRIRDPQLPTTQAAREFAIWSNGQNCRWFGKCPQ